MIGGVWLHIHYSSLKGHKEVIKFTRYLLLALSLATVNTNSIEVQQFTTMSSSRHNQIVPLQLGRIQIPSAVASPHNTTYPQLSSSLLSAPYERMRFKRLLIAAICTLISNIAAQTFAIPPEWTVSLANGNIYMYGHSVLILCFRIRPLLLTVTTVWTW